MPNNLTVRDVQKTTWKRLKAFGSVCKPFKSFLANRLNLLGSSNFEVPDDQEVSAIVGLIRSSTGTSAIDVPEVGRKHTTIKRLC